VIQNPHADPDQHQKLTTSRGSPLAHAYHVCLMTVTMIVSYPAFRHNNKMTEQTKT